MQTCHLLRLGWGEEVHKQFYVELGDRGTQERRRVVRVEELSYGVEFRKRNRACSVFNLSPPSRREPRKTENICDTLSYLRLVKPPFKAKFAKLGLYAAFLRGGFSVLRVFHMSPQASL